MLIFWQYLFFLAITLIDIYPAFPTRILATLRLCRSPDRIVRGSGRVAYPNVIFFSLGIYSDFILLRNWYYSIWIVMMTYEQIVTQFLGIQRDAFGLNELELRYEYLIHGIEFTVGRETHPRFVRELNVILTDLGYDSRQVQIPENVEFDPEEDFNRIQARLNDVLAQCQQGMTTQHILRCINVLTHCFWVIYRLRLESVNARRFALALNMQEMFEWFLAARATSDALVPVGRISGDQRGTGTDGEVSAAQAEPGIHVEDTNGGPPVPLPRTLTGPVVNRTTHNGVGAEAPHVNGSHGEGCNPNEAILFPQGSIDQLVGLDYGGRNGRSMRSLTAIPPSVRFGDGTSLHMPTISQIGITQFVPRGNSSPHQAPIMGQDEMQTVVPYHTHGPGNSMNNNGPTQYFENPEYLARFINSFNSLQSNQSNRPFRTVNHNKELIQQGILFSDNRDGKPLDIYFGMLEKYLVSQDISPELLMDCIHVTLKGAPLEWYWEVFRHGLEQDFPAFRQRLRIRFDENLGPSHSLTQAMSIKYPGSGNLLAHIDKVSALLSKGGIRRHSQMELLRLSLTKDMQRMLVSNSCGSVEEMCGLLKRMYPKLCVSKTESNSFEASRRFNGDFNRNANRAFGKSVAVLMSQTGANDSQANTNAVGNTTCDSSTAVESEDTEGIAEEADASDLKPDFIAQVCALAMHHYNNGRPGRVFGANNATPNRFAPKFPNRSNSGGSQASNMATSSMRCYNCDEIGHGFHNCPQPQARHFCYSCGAIDEKATSCNSERCIARRGQQKN